MNGYLRVQTTEALNIVRIRVGVGCYNVLKKMCQFGKSPHGVLRWHNMFRLSAVVHKGSSIRRETPGRPPARFAGPPLPESRGADEASLPDWSVRDFLNGKWIPRYRDIRGDEGGAYEQAYSPPICGCRSPPAALKRRSIRWLGLVLVPRKTTILRNGRVRPMSSLADDMKMSLNRGL